jgi:hypothetical protein
MCLLALFANRSQMCRFIGLIARAHHTRYSGAVHFGRTPPQASIFLDLFRSRAKNKTGAGGTPASFLCGKEITMAQKPVIVIDISGMGQHATQG